MQLVFWCLDTFGNAIGRPMPALGSPGLGHWIEERFATSLLVIWHMEFAIGPAVIRLKNLATAARDNRNNPSHFHWLVHDAESGSSQNDFLIHLKSSTDSTIGPSRNLAVTRVTATTLPYSYSSYHKRESASDLRCP